MMHIGIDEVLLYDRVGGARQCELALLPALVRSLDAQGHHATIYLGTSLAPAAKMALAAQGVGRLVQTPIPAVPSYRRALCSTWHLPQRVRRDGVNLYHAHGYPLPPVSVLTVLTVHEVRFVHLPDTYTPGRLAFLRRARRTVAVSANTAQDLTTHFGVPADRIDVAPVPLHPGVRRVDDREARLRVRTRYGLPESYILCVGHLEPRSNLGRLVEAYIQLNAAGIDAPSLVILGHDSFGSQPLFDAVGKSGLAHRLRFTGFVDAADMAAAYSMASLLVFPSLHEGFGLPLIEAMACGVPVVASTAGALPEVAGGAAVLVTPHRAGEIAAGMAAVLLNRALREELIERGAARVRDFTPEKSAMLVMRAYEKALL